MNRMRTFIRKWKGFFRGYLVEKAEEGMTLIELMVVIVILGIIAAVAIPSISGVISTSKTNTTMSNLSTIQQALSRYEIDHGSFPATLSLLSEVTDSTGTIASTGYGPYLNVAFPENDSWGHPIYYSPVGTSSDYTGYYLLSGDTTAYTSTSTAPTVIKAGDMYAAGGVGVTPQTPAVAPSNTAITATFNDK